MWNSGKSQEELLERRIWNPRNIMFQNSFPICSAYYAPLESLTTREKWRGPKENTCCEFYSYYSKAKKISFSMFEHKNINRIREITRLPQPFRVSNFDVLRRKWRMPWRCDVMEIVQPRIWYSDPEIRPSFAAEPKEWVIM